ncbi:MAG: FtsX-like permease family protein [Acidimicrobiia bacterium]
MSVLRFWFGTTLRSRWRAYLGVAVLLALLGGLSLASLAGARRTASAYPRFREAGGALDVHFFHVGEPELARRLPGVTGSATYFSFIGGAVDADGRPDPQYADLGAEMVGSFDGLYFSRDRFVVTEGRMADPARADQVVVNEHAAAQGLRLGDRVRLGVFDPADEDAVFSDTPPPPVDVVEVAIVGIGLFPDEVVQDDTDRFGRVLLTPAFTERNRRWASYGWTGVSLEGGEEGVARFKRDYLAGLPGEGATSFRERSGVVARTQEAVRPLVVALGAFGAMAAVATLLLVGQALVRLLRSDREDLVTMRAMGAGPRELASLLVPGMGVSVALGATGAVIVAVALSPLAPIGPLRRIEPQPGVAFDWTVLLLGAAALAVLLAAIGLIAAARQVPHRRQARARLETSRRSALAGVVAAAGLPLPAVAGMRLALESGEGRTSVPARAALGGAVVAVMAMVASLVFGTSLRGLVDRPQHYGWDWDITVLDESGYGEIDVDRAAALLDGDPEVSGWTGVYFQSIDLEGVNVPALGLPPDPAVAPPLLSGRGVGTAGEIVLGTQTLETLGKRVGDTVVLGSQEGERPLRIVGAAVFPTVGPILGAYTSLGEGALMVYDAIPGWDEVSPGPKALFVRLADGVDPEAATARLEEDLAGIGRFPQSAQILPVQRPAQIVHYEAMGAAPAVLGGVLVVAAVVSLGLALASGVGRRRRDLSVLKSLGFTRRQVASTVVWQSSLIVGTGLVAGVPLGVALGRWLWILFADRLPVLARPSVPVLLLTGLACALVVLANLVAAVPAQVAGRTPVASVLRTE